MSNDAIEGEDLSLPKAILVVYAHPDDESFGPAAVLARYAQAGVAIYGIFATRGEHGQTNNDEAASPTELGRLREVDLREAAQIIGFRAVEMLGYEDGSLSAVPLEELEERVLTAIRRFQPEVVITFGPAGISRHPDHLAISRATTAMFHRARVEGAPVRELYYDAVPPELAAEMGLADEIDGQPNTFIEVTATMPLKIAALKMHARHILDAQEMALRLEQTPQITNPLYRAWPDVADGVRLTGFLQP